MTEMDLKLIELINEGNTINELSSKLNLSKKQLHVRLIALKRKGIDLQRTFYNDADIGFDIIKKFSTVNVSNSTEINFKEPIEKFEAMLVSDLHLGSICESLESIKRIYEYCNNNGINIIINTGDFIDGIAGKLSKKHESIYEQIEYALRKHPYDKNIMNFMLLGNHDASSRLNDGIDLSTLLENKRVDFVSIGYASGSIKLKKDELFLVHPVKQIKKSVYKSSLVLKGHSHECKLYNEDFNKNLVVYLPSLSNLSKFNNLPPFPSAMLMELYFNHNKKFSKVVFTQLLVDSKVIPINRVTYDLGFLYSKEEEEKVYKKT